MSDSTTTRRTLAKGAAWSVPVILTGIAAPAASASSHPVSCAPSFCKRAGAKKQWSYVVAPNCTSGTVSAVIIDGTIAVPQGDGSWVASFSNSGAWRPVVIEFTDGSKDDIGRAQFMPCK